MLFLEQACMLLMWSFRGDLLPAGSTMVTPARQQQSHSRFLLFCHLLGVLNMYVSSGKKGMILVPQKRLSIGGWHDGRSTKSIMKPQSRKKTPMKCVAFGKYFCQVWNLHSETSELEATVHVQPVGECWSQH